ncbi:MAG: discoidin domain-containing protein [Chloroflexi bacterium]|nr:MAG: discoidin domain-containing protein [Chloroflexota bacterium]
MKAISSPQYQQWDEEVIKILKCLGALEAEYPSGLFTARRADFILQVQQQNKSRVGNGLASRDLFLKHVESLKLVTAEYPPDLMAARRAEFVDKIKQYGRVEVTEELYPGDQEIIRLLKSVKSVEPEYPPNLMAARRTAFQRQAALGGRISVLEALRTFMQSLFPFKLKTLSMPTMSAMRTSLVVLVLMLATFVGSLVRSPVPLASVSSQTQVAQPGSVAPATNTQEVAKVICKPGYLPPLCLAKEFDKRQDLTFQGNGSARPAVAKDTLPGYSGVHKAAYVNDGLYGPGTSWVSNSAYSWVKIDLGKTATINTVAFGRDRLGSFNDRDPGQFVIAVALNDSVYADGNSSNDYIEYTEIYNSDQAGFDGQVSGPETVKAQFGPVTARFVKIIFANRGTAVDEVEVFMEKPPVGNDYPTSRPKENGAGNLSTAIPASTSVPTETALPIPTNTPVPPDTATPAPTNTSKPTDTPIPPPTNTPQPPPTNTSVPPTDIVEPTAVPPTAVPPTEPPAEPPAESPAAIEPMVVPTDISVTQEGT